MNEKIFFGLFVMFCLVQGLNSRATQQAISRISNENTIQTLNELINKLKTSIEKIEGELDKIEEINKENITEFNLPEIIDYILEQIEELTEKHNPNNTALTMCLMVIQRPLTDLQYLASKGVKEICFTETEQIINKIEKDLTDISLKAAISVSKISKEIMKCYNLKDKAELCLKSLVKVFEKDINALVFKIEETIEKSSRLAETAEKDSTQCVAEIKIEVENLPKRILQIFEQCIST